MSFGSRLSTIVGRILGKSGKISPGVAPQPMIPSDIKIREDPDQSIVTRQTPGVNVLVITGKLCLGHCNALREHVRRLLSHGEKKGIVLNLENVSYVDSSGVATLLNAYMEAPGSRCGPETRLARAPGLQVENRLPGL